MKIKTGSHEWMPTHLAELKRLKEQIALFLKEQAAARRFTFDRLLEKEADNWFKLSRFPKRFLEKVTGNSLTILGDELGFPFEILRVNGAFLGQTYKIARNTSTRFKPNPNFKICYQFEENDEAFPYYDYIEKTFPVELLEPAIPGNISANVFHISGHFGAEEKEKILQQALENNVLLFFNSCNTFEYKHRAAIKRLSHYVLSYFEIPLDEPRYVEDFPYFFYRELLEGVPLAEAFLKARQNYIEQTGRLTPLLFSLFTSAPNAVIFHSPLARHHQAIEKEIKRVDKEVQRLKDNESYPFFLFDTGAERRETLQSLLNTGKKHIWVRGRNAGVGKTTLLYQALQLFKYGKFKGPIFLSFKEDAGLRDIRPGELGDYLPRYLRLEGRLEGRSDGFPRNGKKVLVLVDGVESNSFLYYHFAGFMEELTEIVGPCRVAVASREACPVEGFQELSMEIVGGDINARRLRACYHIADNIKLPELPLIYKLFSRGGEGFAGSVGDGSDGNGPGGEGPAGNGYPVLDKSRVFARFVRHYQEKIGADRALEMMPDTMPRYFALLAYEQFKNRSALPQKRFIEVLREYRRVYMDESDWWIYDKQRGAYRDAESICGFLLDSDMVAVESGALVFIHDSFYEYFLAYYFYWRGMAEYEEMEETEDTGDNKDKEGMEPHERIEESRRGELDSLVYTEVPDYMRELASSGGYAGVHEAVYLRLVLERLFYTRDYAGIEEIVGRAENRELLKTSEQLWFYWLRGCYFARIAEQGMDELRAMGLLAEIGEPGRLLDKDRLSGRGGRALREACYTILNILFDNSLLEEFFRLALYLEDVCPTMEGYGLLSRGFLHLGCVEESLRYLDLKERAMGNRPGREQHEVRHYAERGLVYYYRYMFSRGRTGRGREDYRLGIECLERAEAYYIKDRREEGNYLFTLREFLRFYLEARKGEEFDRVMERIAAIGTDRHPKTDYIPFLLGLKEIELEKNVGGGLKNLIKGAEGFYGNGHLVEAAVVYVWAYYYTRSREKKRKYLKEAVRVLGEAEEKREVIRNYWRSFDKFLRGKSIKVKHSPGGDSVNQTFLRGAGAVFSKRAPARRRQLSVGKDLLDGVWELVKRLEDMKPNESFRGLREELRGFVLIA